jgi:hypothetical protein
MKKVSLILSGLLALFLLPSCEREIEIKLPDAGNQIVVEGTIEQGLNPIILITRSRNFFDKFPSDFATFLSEFIIQDAEVTISDGFTTVPCNFVADFTQYPFFYYTTTSMVGQIGRNYSITIKVGDKVATASSFLRPPIKFDSIYWRPNIFNINEDSLGFIFTRLTDPDTIGNCYRLFFKSPGNVTFAPVNGSAFDDRFFNGTTFEFFNGRPDQPFVSDTVEGDFFYKLGDTVYVKLAHIGRTECNFYRTLENSAGSNGNPFATPIMVQSNIKGALGVFCALGASYDTLIVPK